MLGIGVDRISADRLLVEQSLGLEPIDGIAAAAAATEDANPWLKGFQEGVELLVIRSKIISGNVHFDFFFFFIFLQVKHSIYEMAHDLRLAVGMITISLKKEQ